jgi:arylformamidase
VDPDGQQPMPFQAAEDYAQTVMAWAQAPLPGLVVTQAVPYGPHRLHRYNVFAPVGAQDAPVLVFWHGGGWTNGYRDYNTFMATQAVKLGCVLVSPSYRLVPAHKFPAAFDDSLRMLAHVHQSVLMWGGAPNRLLLAGHSAGGHLAALVALRRADRINAGVPDAAVRACLPISGIMDLHHPAPAPGSLEERVYAMVLNAPDDDALMSPICWTAGNTVPFYANVGELDSDRVRRSNQRMHGLLALQNALATLRVLPGADHFQTHIALADAHHPWWHDLATAIKEHA